jgi:putative peptidoglycan lipid II flippase
MEQNPRHTHEKDKARVVKAAGIVGFATLLSRIFGFIRDMVVAAFFGAGMATDAFFVAFRIPNLLRRILAEGDLTMSFVPVFTEYLKKRSREEAVDLADRVFTLLAIILTFVTVAGIVFSPVIVTLIAPGFTAEPVKFGLTVFLNRFMFPYIFFISLVALAMGILNSLRHFAAPALAPVVLNLSMIGATLLFKDYFEEPIIALAIGVVIGGFMQLAMQIPVLVRKGVQLRFNFHFSHPGIRRIGMLMLPAFVGSAVYQLNIFISILLASYLPEGSVSYLYYADRIVELPLGIFGIAVGTATLPSFSEHAAREDYEKLKKMISFSLRLILFVTIPAMAAIIVLRVPIISVLFQRGEFDISSTLLTSQALLYYAVGLWAFSGIRVTVSAFYSLQDSRTPVKVAVVALLVNVLMSMLLMVHLRHGGLALAVSISSAVNIVLLHLMLSRKIGRILERDFYLSLGRTILASAIMAAIVYGVVYFMGWNAAGPFSERFLILSVAIAAGLAAFAAASFLLKSTEMTALADMILRRLSRVDVNNGSQ